MTARKNYFVLAGVIASFFAVAMMLPVSIPSASASHADGLVGYWNLDDNSLDSAHGNDGAVSGAGYVDPGAPVTDSTDALDFDGVDDVMEVPDAPELDITGPITVSGWIYIDALTMQATVAGKWGDLGENQRGYLLAVHTDGSPRFYISTNGVNFPVAIGGAITTGEWHHLAGTFGGGTISLYVDGVLVDTTAQAGSIFLNNEALLVGANDGFGGLNRKYTDGKVDEVRIYNRALTAGEVAALMDYEFGVDSEDTSPAYNPVGTDHTVTVMVDPALAEIPVLFEVEGVNTETETVMTDGDGKAVFTYTSNGDAGADTITACVDTDDNGSCDGDEDTVSLTKVWLDKYVTGGGEIRDGKGKPKWTFGGNVGIDVDGNNVGQFQLVNHATKDVCHFNVIDSVTFIDNETIEFVADGNCKTAEAKEGITFVIHDGGEPGKLVDQIEVVGMGLANTPISGGNFQVRAPEVVLIGADSDSYEAPSSCDVYVVDTESIQEAINAASAGNVICVNDGEYNEFVVDKPLTIAGLSNPVDGSAKVMPSDPGVTELALVKSSDVTITGLLFDGVAPFTGFQTAGVLILGDTADRDNVNISYNVIQNLDATAGTASSKGIQWFTEAGSGYSLTNSSITHNVITGIDSTSKGGYGIQTVGDMDNVEIAHNTISDVDGAWGAGIALDAKAAVDTSDVTVVRNHVMDSIWTVLGLTVSVQVENNVDQDGISINENNIEGMVHGSAVPATGNAVNAENNWWGDTDPTDDVAGPVDYTPSAGAQYPLF